MPEHVPSLDFVLNGMPVIRSGDSVYLINYASIRAFEFDRQSVKVQTEKLFLAQDEYRCPFSILHQFDLWWTWHKRLRFDGETTGRVITSMLPDVEDIKRYRIQRPRRTWHEFGVPVSTPRSFLLHSV